MTLFFRLVANVTAAIVVGTFLGLLLRLCVAPRVPPNKIPSPGDAHLLAAWREVEAIAPSHSEDR